MRSFIIIILVLLCKETIFAQSQSSGIKGLIIKNAKSEPLPGAIITLPSVDKRTISDAAGFFRFDSLKPGNTRLEIIAAGYPDTTIYIEALPGTNNIEIKCKRNPIALPQVVITAEKQQSNLQHTPIAVSALNASKVRDYRMWSLEDIAVVAPNVHATLTSDVPQISIRGITQNGGGSFDPPYAIYIDGVMQYDNNSMITQLYDVERIEVLRGPQGTLYGKNATAGVINILTNKPANTRSGYAELSMGNRGTQRQVLGFKTPLIKDRLYTGISGYYSRSNGFVKNVFDNSHFDKNHGYGANFYLRYLPTEKWRMVFNIKSQHTSSDGVFPYINYDDKEAVRNQVTDQDATGEQRRNFLNTSLSVENEHRLFTLNSITSYQYSDRMVYNGAWDFDWTGKDLSQSVYLGRPSDNAAKAIMQELRITNPPIHKRLQWIVGAFYSYYDRKEDGLLKIGEDALAAGDPYAPYGLHTPLDIHNTSYALFGQLTFSLTEKLKLTAGLRQDWEVRNLVTQTDMIKEGKPVTPLVARTDMRGKYHALSPKFNISYQVDSRMLTYLNYARGFRAGGLNTRSRFPDYFTYGPELTSNFEWGIRTSWLNNRLLLNMNAFYIDWKDMQVTVFIPGGAGNYALQNAGRAKSKGLELELSAVPFKGLTFDYSFGYTHGRYSKLTVPNIGAGTETDAKGNVLINQPTATATLALQYECAAFGAFNALLRGEWLYRGTQYFDLLNTIKQNPYSLFNAKVGITSKHFDIVLWSRNLTDRRYLAGIYASGSPYAIPASPITYGITLTGRL